VIAVYGTMGVVLAVLVVFATAVMLTAGSVAVVLWRLRRRNRVVPELRTAAPLSWLVLPTLPARLHRRLRTAIGVARLAQDSPGAQSILRELESHAAVVDDHLVVTSRLRAGRVASLRSLTAQVEGVELVAGRLATAAVEARRARTLPGDAPDPLVRIGEKLAALEEARRDLAHVERHAGLGHPAPAAPATVPRQ
jgi:hypothetical protein